MEKTIIYDIADDQTRVTIYSDNSIDILYADQSTEHYDFQSDFFGATYKSADEVINLVRDKLSADVLAKPSDYEFKGHSKSTLKKLFIHRIKDEAKSRFYDDAYKKDTFTNSVMMPISAVSRNLIDHEEALRIIRLKSLRKLIPLYSDTYITVDMTHI